ncbi:MAG: YdcF family protein, partial [Verrucomicrobiales bacterium]|nr:YdcF family protein [Verrucomicrobiales bacterium]
VMGAELLRRGKGRHLVVGGAAHRVQGQVLVEADLARRWLETLGLARVPVISLGKCINTRDEAVRVAALCRERGWTNVLLVTSAYHMKRAEAVFRTAGVPVTCVPCDFQTEVSVMTESEVAWVPRVAGFQKLSLYVHEQIGWWVYRWRGWITPAATTRGHNEPLPAPHAVTARAAP